ncbi:hypothetical protein MP638_004002, partial [Amoeboaphelidium occidentale]
DLPESLDALIEMSIRADQMLYQRSLERRAAGVSHAPTFTSMSRPTVSVAPENRPIIGASSNAVPMQLDVIQRRGPLTDDERAHRMSNRLCIVCGLSGHFKASCPIAKGRLAKPNEVEGKAEGQ